MKKTFALSFFKPLCRKKTSAKAVACTMIFNTAPTITNLSINSQNRLFSCSGIWLLIGFLVFHPIKISFVKPKACAVIFSTASPVFKFMKPRHKKSILKKKWNLEIFRIDEVAVNVNLKISGFVERLCKEEEKRGCMSSNLDNIFNFLFRCFINLFTNEAVLNIIAQASPRMWVETDFRIKVSSQFDYNIDNIAKIFFMSEGFQ